MLSVVFVRCACITLPSSQVDTTGLYKELGLPKTATAAEIRKAYTRLAREVGLGYCAM
ncbi:MAG: hypothetical protein P4L40_01490 [Terracidiphilus sp.]|nr:hypothetical protein [Terracidiphilus sp.]